MIRSRSCSLPAASALLDALPGPTYLDAYEVASAAPCRPIADAYLGIFGRPPLLARAMMRLRGMLVAPFGLKHPNGRSRGRTETDRVFAPGDTIGGWTIARLTPDEIVAGMDDRHLDFRVSVMRVSEAMADSPRVVLATAVKTHNLLGRFYLALVLPFHRVGVPWLLRRAARQRLV